MNIFSHFSIRTQRCLSLLAIWAIALVSASALSACKGCGSRAPDHRPALAKLLVEPTRASTVRGARVSIDDARVAAKAKSMLDDSALFLSNGDANTKWASVRVSIDLEVITDEGASGADVGMKVHLKITAQPATAVIARYAEDTTAVGQAPLGDTPAEGVPAAMQRLAERTVEDLLRSYVGRQKLWSADEAEVAKALDSGEADARIEAIRVAGARKLKGLLPNVIRLLTDDDESIRDAALGAVVAMGDRSAIRALAESRQMRDSYEMRKVVDAVAALGGAEARDYLSFVAETHDDEEVRRMAQSALERLKRREASVPPTR